MQQDRHEISSSSVLSKIRKVVIKKGKKERKNVVIWEGERWVCATWSRYYLVQGLIQEVAIST